MSRLLKVIVAGLALLVAFAAGGVVGYRFAHTYTVEETTLADPAGEALLAKLRQQTTARQRFASQLQTYFQDQNFNVIVDTRSMPNQLVRGDLHDVLKLNCDVCGRKETAQALLDLATKERLRELNFVTFMVGTFRGSDYWVWDVRENKWLEDRQSPQRTW